VVQESNGFFISGSFDSLERPETSYPLICAFDDFVKQLTSRPDKENQYQLIKDALKHLAATDRLLTAMLPALRQFGPDGRDSQNITTTQPKITLANAPHAHLRIDMAFCRLFQAICRTSTPVVLFLDDLQWAKSAPLITMASLLRNQEIRGLVVLAACRDNEVSMAHPLSIILRDLEDDDTSGKGSATITEIPLNSLDFATVQVMAKDALGYHCPDISNLVWEQGRGNALFSVLLIRHILKYEDRHGPKRIARWPKNVLECFRYESAIHLLTSIIMGLPKIAQEVIILASCFGAQAEIFLLQQLLADSHLQEGLEACQDLICRGQADGTITFAHDQLQQSAYSLIPEGQREATHLDIGKRLWQSLSEAELQKYGFAVVRQLRLGAKLITVEGERYKMAELLLGAGKHAEQTGSFDEAASHFNLGIELLGRRHWRDEYYLCLQLFNRAARSEYCNARYERVQVLTAAVVSNARQRVHKIRAQTQQMEALAGRGEAWRAMNLGFLALRENGQNIPKNVGICCLMIEISKTKRLLNRYSDDDISRLPRLGETSDEAGIVHLMMKLLTYTLATDMTCSILIPLRAVQLMLKHGLCNDAASAFGVLGMMFTNHLDDCELGFRLGRLARNLLFELKSFEHEARVTLTTHSYVFSLKEPLRDLLGPMQSAHLAGIKSGDLEMSMICASNRAAMAVIASVPLMVLMEEMRVSLNLMLGFQGNKSPGVLCLLPCYQFVLNMVLSKPAAQDPVRLCGVVMQEDEYVVENANNTLAMALVSFFKLLLGCYFHDYRSIDEYIRQIQKGSNAFPPHMRVSVFLYSGIAYASSVHDNYDASGTCRNGKRKGLHLLKDSLRRLRRFVRPSCGRYDAAVCMLQAEIRRIQGRSDEALILYEKAVECARNEGLTNIGGLCLERAAMMIVQIEDDGQLQQRPKDELTRSRSLSLLERSVGEYKKWNAHAKVELIKMKLQHFQDSQKSLQHVSQCVRQ
jgi:predicted ATPase